MENASKALIIAGAVLVSIMIVALGVTIFNKAHSSADTTALDSTEITMFNQKFEKYAGKNQSGSNVKSLISFAISNASTNQDEPRKLPKIQFKTNGTDKYVTENGTNASGAISNYIETLSATRSDISSTRKYEVKLEYGDSGLVKTVTITEK